MSGNYTGCHQHNASGSSHSEVSFFSPVIGVVLLHLAHAEWHPSYQIKRGKWFVTVIMNNLAFSQFPTQSQCNVICMALCMSANFEINIWL